MKNMLTINIVFYDDYWMGKERRKYVIELLTMEILLVVEI